MILKQGIIKEVVMVLKQLKEYLDKHGVRYVVIQHSAAYTAREVASLSHIPVNEIAKTVVLKVDGERAMAVLPGSEMVDLAALRTALQASSVELAGEAEFNTLFPECEIGAMPPFGNLFGLQVIAADTLAGDEEIAFNAGTHHDLVKMKYKDFERLVQPKVLKFSVARRVRPNPYAPWLS
jgi:Ala-tRNA(Pro) deacylase